MFTRAIKLLTLLIIVLFIPLACEDLEAVFVDCEKCFSDKPEYATVSIRFTINKENPSVFYTLYSGSIDCDSIIATDVANKSVIKWDLEPNKTYSVVAEYYNGGRFIYAVDGTHLKAKHNKSSCNYDCYIILGDELDVRLKY